MIFEVRCEYPLETGDVRIIARVSENGKFKKAGTLLLSRSTRPLPVTHYVGWVFVKPKYRRQGIALAMYEFAKRALHLNFQPGDTNAASKRVWDKFFKIEENENQKTA